MTPLAWTLAGLSGGATVAVAVAGAAALTALHLLRRRRARLVVPFLALWAPAGGEGRAERIARRLRRWLSLALQLALLALLVGAAADPRRAARGGGRDVVLLVDSSASMQARDEPGTRMGRARAIGRDVVDAMEAEDRVMVVGFSAGVSALTGFESDHARLGRAIDGLRAEDQPADLEAAFAFAGAVLRGKPHPTIIVIGDGGGSGDGEGDGHGAAEGDASVDGAYEGSGRGAGGGVDVKFFSVGRRRDNVGLVAFAARRPVEAAAVAVAVADVSLVVQSFRAAPADVTVAITSGPARRPVARQTLHLPAGARVPLALGAVPAPDARLQAELVGWHDDLPLDDRAFTVVPEAPPIPVRVVGDSDLYLDGALISLGDVRVERAPAADGATAAANADADVEADADGGAVVIFDGVAPVPVPARGRFLYIDPHGPGSPWRERGSVRDPLVSAVAREHPLMRAVSLADLNIATARVLALGAGDEAVASALGAPLIIARSRPGLRMAALAFDLRRSDLPLRSAFPLLLANALAYLGDRPAPEPLSHATGRTVRVTLPGRAGRTGREESAAGSGAEAELTATVTAPDGARARAPVSAGVVSLPLERAGFYQIAAPGLSAPLFVAANLASPAESDTAPRAALRFGARTVAATAPPAPRRPGGGGRRPELAALALGAALALATLEWLAFHRRLTV